MTAQVLTETVASISELKKNPMKTVDSAAGRPLAILNRNRPVFYCVPPVVWHEIQERLEDFELARLAAARIGEKEIPVDLEDL